MPTQNTRIPTTTKTRAAQRRRYAKQREIYLLDHPFDMIWIALNGLDEKLVIEANGYVRIGGLSRRAPRSTQIHHRNKCDGDRLLDERFWITSSDATHTQVELRKSWAREEGFLLPIQADANGAWGSGNQGLETPAFMASKIRKIEEAS